MWNQVPSSQHQVQTRFTGDGWTTLLETERASSKISKISNSNIGSVSQEFMMPSTMLSILCVCKWIWKHWQSFVSQSFLKNPACLPWPNTPVCVFNPIRKIWLWSGKCPPGVTMEIIETSSWVRSVPSCFSTFWRWSCHSLWLNSNMNYAISCSKGRKVWNHKAAGRDSNRNAARWRHFSARLTSPAFMKRRPLGQLVCHLCRFSVFLLGISLSSWWYHGKSHHLRSSIALDELFGETGTTSTTAATPWEELSWEMLTTNQTVADPV